MENMSYLDKVAADVMTCTITRMFLRVAAAALNREGLKVAVVGDCSRISGIGEIVTGDEKAKVTLDYFAARKSFYFKSIDEIVLSEYHCILVLHPDPDEEARMCGTLVRSRRRECSKAEPGDWVEPVCVGRAIRISFGCLPAHLP